MSQTEFQRFVTAMQATPALAETYNTAATPADLAGRLRADGYDVTEADITDQAADGAELSDEDLDGVAGGARWRPLFRIRD
ncbi:Nif11-like leader peptide family natural product precursor [Azospirillum cavernae]|uniref:Nif11-like leader peptide family natural product n=1 Tax=Azospirillum cavernae TaxID=2320860 RepID=A0A418VQB2_9PROT|nr:Nif11-like leader peptide family RiPP precursor [Azospirillum cavernae]RJF78452.1 Nif11-like leader peptide family natural product precursor [Azospirillum cavernae]